jgi:23S rRNA (adenine2503-C2)-methyltransferase
MTAPQPHTYDYDYNAFDAIIRDLKASQYTAEIWRYLYREYVSDFHEMISLPPELRNQLADRLSLEQLKRGGQVISADGNTRKDLLVLDDAQGIEVVLLRYRERFSACVSTQVGCACGCVFCATGQMGFERQLSAGEILAQVIYLQRVLKEQGQTLSNVVLMGMGEPLLNYDATLSAVRQLTDSRGFGIGPKRITLSTVGIAPAIRKLAGEPIPIKLALSLHAATDALRDAMMPINRRYPLESLWETLRYYTAKTGRRVLLEWIMIKGVNDTPQAAHSLVSWVRDLPVHVNLIQLNVTDSFSGEPSTDEAVEAFISVLDRHQILHTMRQRRGGSIQAGCGQLRSRQAAESAALGT